MVYEDENEDEIVHRTSSEDRILRGKIVPSDDPDFVVLRRRDGEWLVAKSAIITIRRALEHAASPLLAAIEDRKQSKYRSPSQLAEESQSRRSS